jgi:Ca2+:H+ antiporter
MSITPRAPILRLILPEIPVALGLATGVAALAHWGPTGPADGASGLAWTAWLIAAIVAAAMRAMTHADHVAERLGEPLGTIVLTISAIIIEVAAVCAVMLGSQGDPDIARDTMFAVIMLILNLLLGVCMLVSGWRGHEREFNPQSSNSYLPLLITLACITMVLPRFTRSTPGGWMSDPMELFVGASSLVLYGVFLFMQSTRHRNFFAHHGVTERQAEPTHHAPPPLGRSCVLLVLALLAVIGMAEGLGGRTRDLLQAWSLPLPLGGILIALLVLAPEGLAAIGAARRHDMQRSINILLGSALATIGLTVPAIIGIRFATGVTPQLGLEPPFIVLLATTFFVTTLSLARGRVSTLQGMVHILLFLAWIVTILDEASAAG